MSARVNGWLYVHAPYLLLDEQLAAQAENEREQPQVLLQQQGSTGPRVVQLNAAAQTAGIQRGMAMVTATTLVPDLICRDYQHNREQWLLQQLAQLLYQDVAQIALQPPQGLLFEVRSLLRLYGGWQALQKQLQQRLQEAPIRYYWASGYSPLAARLLAQAEVSVLSADPQVTTAALAQLPIQASGLETRAQQRLLDVGMTTLGSLLQRSNSALGARFGKDITHYLAELRGDFSPPQRYYRPPAQFYQRIDLLSEVESWPQLVFALKRLLQQLEVFLQGRQLSTRSLRLQAYHRDQAPTVVVIQFAHAVWQQRDMLQLCQLHLERQVLPFPALELSIRVRELENRQAHANSLLPVQQELPAVAALVSRLQARLGEHAIQVPQVQADWRPEHAHRLDAWSSNQAAASAVKPSQRRPVWLLPEAQPIDRRQWQVHWGPERLQSGWWDDQPCVRDYFIAVDAFQRQGWIYHDPRGWFLHGWFS